MLGYRLTEVNTGHVLAGELEGEVDIVGVQIIWRML